MLKKLFLSFFVLFFSTNICISATMDPLPQNTLYMELKDGVVVIELLPDKAPRHVQRISSLTNDGFYDGLKFHRVIQNFMAQTGDPTGTGRGGSTYGRLYAEFNDEPHTRGAVSMARAADINSANSQFFIITGNYFPELDRQYTVFGRVIDGMKYVDKIKTGDTAKNGVVLDPDGIVKMLLGTSLNNKPLSVVKQEIAVVNQLQVDAAKQDPKFIKKSVLEMLEQSKDIDITGANEAVNVPEEKEIISVETPKIENQKPHNEVTVDIKSNKNVNDLLNELKEL